MSTEEFQLEIDKEIHRSNRRTADPEFAMVLLDFSDHDVPDGKLETLIKEFSQRLRVSDSLGWHQLKLGALLPETGREGAVLVSESLLDIAKSHNVEMEATISIYPWDDRLLGPYEGSNRSFDKGSNGKGSNGTDPNWSEFHREDDPFGDAYQFANDSSSGGVATLAPPVKRKLAKRSLLPAGTGARVAFSRSEKTPAWKRVIDVVGAGTGLLLLSPVLVAAAVAIKATSDGPVFFRQDREGKDGETFKILKFRTMCQDAELKKEDLRVLSEQDGPAFKLKDDPRITRVGRYLRKSCVDELPQLLNVLTGEMSLVGPRPLPVNESQQCLPWQRQRLTVLPGLTCTWQARGGRDIKFAEWMRMDLDYIEQRGFWNDLRLIGETAMVVVMHKGSV